MQNQPQMSMVCTPGSKALVLTILGNVFNVVIVYNTYSTAGTNCLSNSWGEDAQPTARSKVLTVLSSTFMTVSTHNAGSAAGGHGAQPRGEAQV